MAKGETVAVAKDRRDDLIKVLKSFVEPLAAALGPQTEVVLHDLRNVDRSVVAIAGEVTGRNPGAPATDVLLQHLQAGRNDDLIGYWTATKSGRKLRSSTLFIRSEYGVPFACLCINVDMSDWLDLSKSLMALLGLEEQETSEPVPVIQEEFVPSVEELAISSVNKAIDELGIPVALMKKQHRLDIVKRLDAVGFFLIQDAVLYVAAALQISRHSVYKYLREITDRSTAEPLEGRPRRATNRQLPIPSDVADTI